jgi:hypothetical protein
MRARVPGNSPLERLGLVGLGIGVIGVAFTLRPPAHISPTVFWSVLVIGTALVVIGVAALGFERRRGRRKEPDPRAQALLVAAECNRIAEVMGPFVAERWRRKPRSGPFSGGADRERRWREETEELYRSDYRTWSLETFDAAARLGGVARSSRSCVERPSPEQMRRLPELFRDAAKSLERR